MANVDNPFGLRPVGHLLGLDWSSRLRRCFMTGASGATYIGDAVDLAGSADATGAYPTIAPITVGATHPIFGVVVAFEPDPTDLTLLYRKNSTDRYAMVCCDPFVIFEVQGDSTGVITKDMVGANAVLVGTHSGSTTTGLSGMEMYFTTTPAANATYQLLILGASNDPHNDISLVNAKWQVLISLHRLGSVYSNSAQAGWLGV
jgi:hypothetical protein